MAETVTERDLHALHVVIEDGHRDEPTSGVPWAVLDGLAALVPCDAVSFPEADLVRGRGFLLQVVEDGGYRLLQEGADVEPTPPDFWKCVRDFRPCNHPYRTGDLASVVRWSDFYSDRQLRSIPLVTDHFEYRHGMHMAFPSAPGHMRKISFWRSAGPDFSERDRMVAQLLRPHLWEIYVDSQRRRRALPHLSPREWEVLQLADQGYSNAEVASRLHISVATVRKHMEHIFDRTGARTRSSAAAVMMSRRHPEPFRSRGMS